MSSQSVAPQKKRGPAPTGKGVSINLRLQPLMLEAIDALRADLINDLGGGDDDEEFFSRPETIRRIVLLYLQDKKWVRGHVTDGDAKEVGQTLLDFRDRKGRFAKIPRTEDKKS